MIHVTELGMEGGFNGRFGDGARFCGDYANTGDYRDRERR